MKLAILLFIIYIVTGCDSERTPIYSTQECIENYQSTNLRSITSSAQKFDSSFVELIGFYHWGPEASAISTSKVDQYTESMLSVNFNSSIVHSLEKNGIGDVFRTLSGKKIKIRGRIHSKDRGHGELFAAT